MINIKSFESKLLKIDTKSYEYISIYNIGYIAIKKVGDCENIYTLIFCIYLLIMQTDILKKKV